MSAFTIMVDSNCDLPPEYLEEHGIEVLSMPFELDGAAHAKGYWQDISGVEYYGALRGGRVAKTSQINPDAFEAIFSAYAAEGKPLLLILLSSGLSATYENALIALEEVKTSFPACDIHVIDSINATSGHGLLAMLAAEKRAEGLSAREAAAWLEEKKHSCHAIFTVDDLMYLHRGGRLSKLSAIAGTLLGIKPILNIAPDGTLCQREKIHGHKAALRKMVEQLKRCVGPEAALDTVLISHTDCPQTAQTLAEMVGAAVNVRKIVVMLMGPVIGAHLGPGAVTLLFEGDVTREAYESRYYG